MISRFPRLSPEERLLGQLDPAYARHRRIVRFSALVAMGATAATAALAISGLVLAAACSAGAAALGTLVLWRVGGKGDTRAALTHWAERRWEANRRAVALPKSERRSVGSKR